MRRVVVLSVVVLLGLGMTADARVASFGRNDAKPTPSGGSSKADVGVRASAGGDAVAPTPTEAGGGAADKPKAAAGQMVDPNAAAKKKKKRKSKKKQRKEKPKEIVDLMLDVGGTMCAKLGTLVKRKKFSVEKRCDLLKFCIEDLTGMFDAMASELELTQQDLVDNALQMHHFMTFQMNMKNIVKQVLGEKKPSEEFVSGALNKMMSQWILNVATGQGPTSGGQVGKMSREAQKNLRNMGIQLPSYGQMDDDDLDEENALLGDDFNWADESNKIAEIFDADDDEDDDDDDDGDDDGPGATGEL